MHYPLLMLTAILPSFLINSGKEQFNAFVLTEHFIYLRKVQLRVFYFNRLCSSIVYSVKLMCLSVCIVGIFFGIKLFRHHELIAIVSGCVRAS